MKHWIFSGIGVVLVLVLCLLLWLYRQYRIMANFFRNGERPVDPPRTSKRP
jgi:hypothetical protein